MENPRELWGPYFQLDEQNSRLQLFLFNSKYKIIKMILQT